MTDPTPAPFLPPEGFKLQSGGPHDTFAGVNGPLYRKRDGDFYLLGLRGERRHCNPMGICHGGMLMTLIDMALVLGSNYQAKIGRFLPTINLSADFLAPAPEGAWLEARTDVLRVARSTVFAQCIVTADGTRVARGSGVFKIGRALPASAIAAATAGDAAAT